MIVVVRFSAHEHNANHNKKLKLFAYYCLMVKQCIMLNNVPIRSEVKITHKSVVACNKRLLCGYSTKLRNMRGKREKILFRGEDS